jgi:hypothetical protein
MRPDFGESTDGVLELISPLVERYRPWFKQFGSGGILFAGASLGIFQRRLGGISGGPPIIFTPAALGPPVKFSVRSGRICPRDRQTGKSMIHQPKYLNPKHR